MNNTVKLDSYKEYTPQNLTDELQKMIDNKVVEDVIIISRNGDDVHLMTSPLTDVETVGLLEVVKTNVALSEF